MDFEGLENAIYNDMPFEYREVMFNETYWSFWCKYNAGEFDSITRKEYKSFYNAACCVEGVYHKRGDEAFAYIMRRAIFHGDEVGHPELLKLKEKYSGGCYVATAIYGSYDCPQVWTLRRYRDNYLSKSWYGRSFIHMYYTISPTIVKWFGETIWFKNMWKGKLDKMVSDLQAKGVESTPYEDKVWK